MSKYLLFCASCSGVTDHGEVLQTGNCECGVCGSPRHPNTSYQMMYCSVCNDSTSHLRIESTDEWYCRECFRSEMPKKSMVEKRPVITTDDEWAVMASFSAHRVYERMASGISVDEVMLAAVMLMTASDIKARSDAAATLMGATLRLLVGDRVAFSKDLIAFFSSKLEGAKP